MAISRPSLAERYRGFDDYQQRYLEAAERLVAARYLLEEDLPRLKALCEKFKPLFATKANSGARPTGSRVNRSIGAGASRTLLTVSFPPSSRTASTLYHDPPRSVAGRAYSGLRASVRPLP